MLRYFFLVFILAVVTVVSLAGFRGQRSQKTPLMIFPDMDFQPRFDPQHDSKFFADSRAGRPPVPGTVPLGYTVPHLYYATSANNNRFAKNPGAFSIAPDYYNTGRIGDSYGDGIPLEMSSELMERGRERFTINCAICHGPAGDGKGIVSQYGLVGIANLMDGRIRTMPDGQIFNTITHGKNTMGAYGSNVTVEDRWAIISYIRAVQRSSGGTINDVPADQRAQLDQAQQPQPQPQAK
jgi:mono/diheme cytochrome c family protein